MKEEKYTEKLAKIIYYILIGLFYGILFFILISIIAGAFA